MRIGSSVETFNDPDAHAARIHNVCGRVRPMRGGPYRARLILVRLPAVNLAMSEETVSRRFACETSPDRVFFRLKHDDEPPSTRNGHAAEPGTVGIGGGGRPVDDRAAGPSRWRSVSMPVADFAIANDTLLQRSLPSPFGGPDLLHPASDAFARLALLQRDAFRLAAEAPEVLEHPEAGRMLDGQITEALVAMLESVAPPRETAAARRHHAVLRRVVAHIEASEARPIALPELCKAGGCSVKVLEQVFVEFFGQTPNRHLRLRRLWGARRALLAADPREATVSSIALDWGFWELGRFAVAYRQTFGESPSQSLRRLPGSTPPRTAIRRPPRSKTAKSA